jgi:hypothetical protein
MSDLSVLWHEYERYEDLTRNVTADVTALKRLRFGLPGSETVTAEQRAISRGRLQALVGAIATALSQSANLPQSEKAAGAAPRLPGALIEQIRQAHGGMLPRFVEDVLTLRQHLTQGEQDLTSRDIELLDDLSNSVHTETSRVFRRLYRK